MARLNNVWCSVFLALTMGVCSVASGGVAPMGQQYMIFDDWGGTLSDVEKSPNTPEDDDYCWAGVASNILEWTGWGHVDGMTTTDEMFQYCQDHWTQGGGLPGHALEWWFDGQVNLPSTWAQPDGVGGGLHTGVDFSQYYARSENRDGIMSGVDTYLRAGYATSITIHGPGGHALTVWGFNYNPANPGEYYGVWVTDTDDNLSSPTPPDTLDYYGLIYTGIPALGLPGEWFLDDFYGSDAWRIDSLDALQIAPASTPEPTTLSLLALVTLLQVRRRRPRRGARR